MTDRASSQHPSDMCSWTSPAYRCRLTTGHDGPHEVMTVIGQIPVGSAEHDECPSRWTDRNDGHKEFLCELAAGHEGHHAGQGAWWNDSINAPADGPERDRPNQFASPCATCGGDYFGDQHDLIHATSHKYVASTDDVERDPNRYVIEGEDY